ncbi:putative oxidoreductase [Helianthus anomalus]
MLSRSIWILKWVITMIIILAKGNPPEEPIKCSNNFTNCTITNSYGAFPDRSTCHAAEAAYPSSEQDVVLIVANATRAKRKMRVATRYSHSIPKLVCPDGENGLIISTENLNRVIKIDKEKMLVTLESGVTLRQLIDEAAKSGLAFPYTPYWWGLTIGGLLGTGAHGSTLWGDGSSIHDYVVQMRIVTAGSEEDGYAKVRTLEENGEFDGEMKAAKVSLGVLGVISQVLSSV